MLHKKFVLDAGIWDEAGETVGLGDAEQLSWGFLMILMEDIGNYRQLYCFGG